MLELCHKQETSACKVPKQGDKSVYPTESMKQITRQEIKVATL
jgi:hypothetical protein